MMINESLNLEIWDRLIQGKRLDGLPLETKDGRIYLGGLGLPKPSVVKRYSIPAGEVAEIEPGAIIQNSRWNNLDFTGSVLNGLRLFSCEIINCRFDECDLQDLRLWSTKVECASFRSADLRKSALGGVQEGRRNTFSAVDFSGADLRQTAYTAASFSHCSFNHAKLVKVDFQTSSFVKCRFEGELRNVIFYRRAFKAEAFPENQMTDVDFSQAILHHVEFRGLSMHSVILPTHPNHIIIPNYHSTLERVLAVLRSQTDSASKKLAAYFGVLLKWSPNDQQIGVVNAEDLVEIAGKEAVERLRGLLITSI